MHMSKGHILMNDMSATENGSSTMNDKSLNEAGEKETHKIPNVVQIAQIDIEKD